MHPVPVSSRAGFFYVERARIDRSEHGLLARSDDGEMDIPADRIAALLLGPGTSISHSAMDLCARSVLSILWTGESGVRLYAAGNPRSDAAALLRQAGIRLDEKRRLRAAREVWRQMFGEDPAPNRSIDQLRGDEGVRVRAWLPRLANDFGLEWGRRDGSAKDPINQAINIATSTLYGVCEAAILALGYSPAIGMIHDGDPRSFVFDVADTVKFRTVVPLALRAAAESAEDLGTRVRHACRDLFFREKLIDDLVLRTQGILDAADRT